MLFCRYSIQKIAINELLRKNIDLLKYRIIAYKFIAVFYHHKVHQRQHFRKVQ